MFFTRIQFGDRKTIKKKVGVEIFVQVICNVSLKRELGWRNMAFFLSHAFQIDFSRPGSSVLVLVFENRRTQTQRHLVSFTWCSIHTSDAFIMYSGMWLYRAKCYLGNMIRVVLARTGGILILNLDPSAVCSNLCGSKETYIASINNVS